VMNAERRTSRNGDEPERDAGAHGPDGGIDLYESETPQWRRIFGRFERAVVPRPRPGFGIGLWVSRNFVQAMGGSIDVMSSTEGGSVFTVTLPIDGRRTNER